MKFDRYHSLRPGEAILHSKQFVAVEYRRDLKTYLDEYPKGKDKNDLKGRLWSYTESGFYSACFELFLHHFLSTRCQAVDPHPVLPNVTTHPEFEVKHSLGNFFVEATLALESEEFRAQEQRLRELVDAMREVKGSVVLWAQPVTDLPNDFPLDSVRDFLSREVQRLDPTDLESPKSLTFATNFNNRPVVIDFDLISADQDSCEPVVQAWGAPKAKEVTTHYRIRRRVRSKASRYGHIGAPYIVAVWPRAEFPLTSEGALRGLYGDRQIHIARDTNKIIGETRALNGAFNTTMNGNLLNREVSAVALYRERFLARSYRRCLYVYHNPYALNPVPEQILSGVPQFVSRKDKDNGGHMQWLDDISPWDE